MRREDALENIGSREERVKLDEEKRFRMVVLFSWRGELETEVDVRSRRTERCVVFGCQDPGRIGLSV